MKDKKKHNTKESNTLLIDVEKGNKMDIESNNDNINNVYII